MCIAASRHSQHQQRHITAKSQAHLKQNEQRRVQLEPTKVSRMSRWFRLFQRRTTTVRCLKQRDNKARNTVIKHAVHQTTVSRPHLCQNQNGNCLFFKFDLCLFLFCLANLQASQHDDKCSLLLCRGGGEEGLCCACCNFFAFPMKSKAVCGVPGVHFVVHKPLSTTKDGAWTRPGGDKLQIA